LLGGLDEFRLAVIVDREISVPLLNCKLAFAIWLGKPKDIFSKLAETCTLRKVHHNCPKASKFGAGEGWRMSFGPIA
jgi:hypothetical protein